MLFEKKNGEDLRERVRRICEILERKYGRKNPIKRNPFDTLILTILSQNTNFKNCKAAYDGLIATYKTWEEVLEAPDEDIANAIRIGGLARIKAMRIKSALSRIKKGVGEVDLGFLAALSTKEAMNLNLIEHGRKICTARKPECDECVLKDYCNKNRKTFK